MRTILLILVSLAVLSFTSCENKKAQQYNRIVSKANRFEVHFNGPNITIVLPASQIQRFKEVITHDIEPEHQRYFLADTRVDLYFDNQLIGNLLIQSGKVPFANFNADPLHFGFRLPYRMGMWINELKEAPRH